MNLEVRAQRQDKDLSDEGKTALEATLAATQASAPVSLKGPDWHRASIRLQGDTLAASIDGKPVVHLKSPGIDHPTKNKFGMTVNGSTIDFDNLQVYFTDIQFMEK